MMQILCIMRAAYAQSTTLHLFNLIEFAKSALSENLCILRLTVGCTQLTTARKQVASQEILLLTTPSETRKALQASLCNELLGLMTATIRNFAEH